MKISIFRRPQRDESTSMTVYADNLILNLPETIDVSDIYPKKLNLPFFGNLGRFGRYVDQYVIYPSIAKKNQGDVNHIIDHSYASIINALDKKKTIVTCHDLIPLKHPESTSRKGRFFFKYNVRAMTKARRIIADSAQTKRDVLKFTDYLSENISIIPLGISEKFKPFDKKIIADKKRELGLEGKKVIIHVGAGAPYKNVSLIIRALNIVETIGSDIKFLKIGPFLDKEKELIKKIDLEKHIINIEYVPNDELPIYYNLADVFVFPSVFEGFGMPPIEAMACGTPTIVSNVPPLNETVGDAQIMVEPFNPEELAEKIINVLTDKELANKMSVAGMKRAKKFSWKNTADLTAKVYEEVCG